MEINREILKSSVRIKRRKIYQFFLYFIFCAAFVFALSNFVFKIDRLAIRRVFVNGNKNVSSEQILNVAKQSLSGTYVWLFPKNNIFIYPKVEIESLLKRNYLFIQEAAISGALGSISLSIVERDPAYLWCDDMNKPSIDRGCYYLDKDGFAFAKAPQFSDEVYLSFYGGNKRGGYMGRNILPPVIFRSLVKTKDALVAITQSKDFNLGNLSGLYIYDNGDFDLLFRKGDFTWKLLFNLTMGSVSDNLSENISEKKLSAIFSSPYFRAEVENPINQLEYIDLRFGKKVFYKFYQK